MNLTTVQRILITLGALLAGIMILTALVIAPAIREITALSNSIEEERLRLEQALRRGAQLRNIAKDLRVLQDGLPALERMTIEKGKEIELFSSLEEKSRAYGLAQTLRLGDSEPADQKNVERLPITAELRGSFLRALRFLADLDRSELLLPIQSLAARLASQSPASLEVSTILTGYLYVSQKP